MHRGGDYNLGIFASKTSLTLAVLPRSSNFTLCMSLLGLRRPPHSLSRVQLTHARQDLWAIAIERLQPASTLRQLYPPPKAHRWSPRCPRSGAELGGLPRGLCQIPQAVRLAAASAGVCTWPTFVSCEALSHGPVSTLWWPGGCETAMRAGHRPPDRLVAGGCRAAPAMAAQRNGRGVSSVQHARNR